MTYAAADTWVMAKRNLMVWARVPAYLVFTIVQPMIFTLLFRYVFGGAIPVDLPGGYVNYLLPGIIGQTAAFASMATAISLAVEVQKGVVDRLRAMPMARVGVPRRTAAGRPGPDDDHHPGHRRHRLRRRLPVQQRIRARRRR